MLSIMLAMPLLGGCILKIEPLKQLFRYILQFRTIILGVCRIFDAAHYNFIKKKQFLCFFLFLGYFVGGLRGSTVSFLLVVRGCVLYY